MSSERWPDGQPVTPWADPWHDVAADIREQMRREADAATWARTMPLVILPEVYCLCHGWQRPQTPADVCPAAYAVGGEAR